MGSLELNSASASEHLLCASKAWRRSSQGRRRRGVYGFLLRTWKGHFPTGKWVRPLYACPACPFQQQKGPPSLSRSSGHQARGPRGLGDASGRLPPACRRDGQRGQPFPGGQRRRGAARSPPLKAASCRWLPFLLSLRRTRDPSEPQVL